MIASIEPRIKPLILKAGPQPWNAGIAGTFDEQILRARQPRPRPSVSDRVAFLERRFAELVRRIGRAGVPA